MTMHEHFLSVIVPVYNVEGYVIDCIKSVLNQTYRNYELILVDDGSTDHSGEICDNLAKKDKRICTLHKANGGLASARNAGIERAKGKYLAFIDSDDMIHPTYLQELLTLAQTYSADLVACDFEHGNVCEWTQPVTSEVEIRCNEDVLKQMNKKDVIVTVTWNKLYHSRYFKELGLRFPQGKIHEDMFLTPQILAMSKKMVITNAKLYFYRERPNSIMTNPFTLKKLDIMEAIQFRIDFFGQMNCDELRYAEYESYIRKARTLYHEMKQCNVQKYKEQMHQLRKNAGKLLINTEIMLHISWKYKASLLAFVAFGF